MPQRGRPSIVPFLLVVAASLVLIAWNCFRAAEILRRPEPAVSTGLEQAFADIGGLLRQSAVTNGKVRQTGLAIRAGQACNVQARHAATFTRLAAGAPASAEPLLQADAALRAACEMRTKLARPLNAEERLAAGTEMLAYLGRSLAAAQTAQAILLGTAGAPPSGGFREPLIGLACGLVCLLFARRPRPLAAEDAADTGDWPTVLEPAENQTTALHLLDDTGSFFYCEVFDRAPLPLLLLDGEGRIIRLNAEAERLAGKTNDQLRRQFYWEALIPESHRESVRSRFAEFHPDAPTRETWTAADGSECTLNWSRTGFREGGAGKPALVLLAGQPAPSVDTATAAVVDAASTLVTELTLIGGHCGLVVGTGPDEMDSDLRQIQEATERAIQATRNLVAHLPGQHPHLT